MNVQMDFHYYATYCAAVIAGYAHEEALDIAYSAQFVDECSVTFLTMLDGPRSAATTQLKSELMDTLADSAGIQDITRIWSSFHFLPRDLYADPKRGGRRYKNKYRLICGPDGELLADTVRLAKGRGLQAAGVAMHVLADTWAHRYFAGTPSLVINNTNYYFYELIDKDGETVEKKVNFNHNPLSADDPETGAYVNSIYQSDEKSIMNLGHGRAGHLPDYSFIKYKYLPAWGDYNEIIKDNPSDYYNAFCQMVYAMKYLRGDIPEFETGRYDTEAVKKWESRIRGIIGVRRLDACEDWRAFGTGLSGKDIEDYDINKYTGEYSEAAKDKKDETFLGKFFLAALAQKSMVTNRIFKSGNSLAGISVDYKRKGFKGIRDFKKLIKGERKNKNE
ncbi:MAG: hypothetical protein IJT91_04570 [Clostridia bacterium]|nr:hypothetical protein [Clostridia bacterium]